MNMNLRQHLKFTARGFLAHAKPSPLLVGLIGVGLMTLLDILNSEVTNEASNYEAMMKALETFSVNQNIEQFTNTMANTQPTFVQGVLSALLTLMILMISTGIVVYVFTEARYHKGSVGNLFDALPILLRVFWYQFLSTVLVFLWSLAFLVPGLIAYYSYRQGLYILLDHPEMSVWECLRASRHMMKGHKMELFKLDLSFVGWSVGQSFVITALAAAMQTSYLPSLLALPLVAFIRMYMEFTYFLYYEHLCGVKYDSRIPNADTAN